jgi:hypothetical protein
VTIINVKTEENSEA